MRTLPAHELPQDALYDSENMLVRDGELRTRPGMKRNSVSIVTGTGAPTGAFNYRGYDGSSLIIVGTTAGIYATDGFKWYPNMITALPPNGNAPKHNGILQGSLDKRSRFTSLEIGTNVYLVHTNGVDPVMAWNGTYDPFRPVAGDPVGPTDEPGDPKACPKFVDIATLGDRVIGILPPYDMRWGNSLALNKWPELNFKALAETADPLVGIQALGTLGAAVYKTDSIYVCFAGAGTSDASFFRFEFRGYFDGPASAGAIVNVSGVHFYMTPTGRIAQFNGSQHVWIADGIWPQLRERVDPTKGKRIFGYYDVKNHEVWFHYPRKDDADGLPHGLVVISLPRPGTGKDLLGSFPGHIAPNALAARQGGSPAHPVSTALTPTVAVAYRLNDQDPKVAVFDGATATTFYNLGSDPLECEPDGTQIGEGKDAGEPFDFFWQTGLIPMPDAKDHRIDSVETFTQRNANFGSLTVKPIRSYNLGVQGGEVGRGFELNLEERQTEPHPLKGFDIRGRFHGLRYEFTPIKPKRNGGTNAPVVRYQGALIYGWPIGA